MAFPKLSDLSSTMQIVAVLAIAAAIWAATEYMILKPVSDSNDKKSAEAAKLASELAPLRDYERKQKVLIAENEQLRLKLATLRTIVPEEKEVDNFIRYIQGAANASGVDVRRFTAKPNQKQDYYTEVPFEVELDGPYSEVASFFDRLGKLERIVNVTDMKIGGLDGGKGPVGRGYAYRPNETVAIVSTIETFFSPEGQDAPVEKIAPKAGAKPSAPVKK